MKQLTVKDLLRYCEQAIKNGHGDKNIVIADDVEGNGYHGLYYDFTELERDLSYASLIYDSDTHSPADTIILG